MARNLPILQVPMTMEALKALKAEAEALGVAPGALGRIFITKSLPQKEQGE